MRNWKEKLHLYVCIAAAFAVALTCVIRRAPLYHMAVWLSITIVVFYLIGQVARVFFTTKVFPPVDVQEVEEYKETDEQSENDEKTEEQQDSFLDS